ncbi:AraC family transcriptional regulator [Skermania sp. ID1734]|uniref:helix-turn-helix transcriptional regulator n=1 Tax=Skermania sp. ID1734 TaxID=2597516 RepID=UPI00118053F4|nr:AraC family transcriptional regulator [Skermania sp. ID1734]TSD93629.1 AraC family transcriptional regulator [Skermania sp. ID1734]
MNSPLAGHRVLATDDVDEFRQQASNLLSAHQIQPASTTVAASFRGHVNATRFGDIDLVYLDQGVDVDVDILDRIDYYDLMLAIGGTNRLELTAGADHRQVSNERARLDHVTGALLSPRMRAAMHMDASYRQLHLRIEKSALDRRVEAMLGRPIHGSIVFDLAVDLTTPVMATWHSSLDVLLRDLDNGSGLTQHPLAASSWQDTLLTGLLLAQPHNFLSALREPAAPVYHSTMRRALAYIDENLDAPITVADIAQQVGTSVRSLQRAFQDNIGATPKGYIQSLRLTRVRDELLDAGTTETVTDIAYRWGFGHLSRFAAAYRHRYGETPSQTRESALRR